MPDWGDELRLTGEPGVVKGVATVNAIDELARDGDLALVVVRNMIGVDMRRSSSLV